MIEALMLFGFYFLKASLQSWVAKDLVCLLNYARIANSMGC